LGGKGQNIAMNVATNNRKILESVGLKPYFVGDSSVLYNEV